MELYNVQFSYIDRETLNVEFVSVPENDGGNIIPEDIGKPGYVYIIAMGKCGMIGAYRVETEIINGLASLERLVLLLTES